MHQDCALVEHISSYGPASFAIRDTKPAILIRFTDSNSPTLQWRELDVTKHANGRVARDADD